jgi:hypothetical protein
MPLAGLYILTAKSITHDEMIPVITNTSSIREAILPRRLILLFAAIAEESEKNTSGTTAVKRRLRNTSPKGLSLAAFSPSKNPIAAPAITDPSSIKVNRHLFKNALTSMLAVF